ncbi:unnamed protein product [Callosobruchus maculatus]|uniref:THAP-type domain-containing protein n=1 Tax=Callosobruchus maculatus TaxID=64391 RepID=A0A653D1J6_CALMS|nr:unnamed protein product [Callosobruchus maculatus]
MFALPARKTLKQLLSKIPINPGLSDVVFNNLTEVVTNLGGSSKYCSLIFDEMSLDPHIDFNVATKEFEGFETHDEKRWNAVIADHALVFMIRGIVADWKQPLAYTFCKSSTKSIVLVRLIKKIITKCQRAGLHVLCTISDQGSTNQAAINYLMKYSSTPTTTEDQTRKYFFINGVKITHIYDPPHLIKGIRNNLLTKNLVWESPEGKHVARWVDIETAYAIDNAAGSLRAMPKLTECHVNRNFIKKMKVSYATQVFSHTVASVMALMTRAEIVGSQGEVLSNTALGTAKVLKFFDDLMDSVNGHTLYPSSGKPLRCAVSRSTEHLEFWNKARDSLRKMYFQEEGSELRFRPPTLNNWLITINGMIEVLETLETRDVHSLRARRLNQDPVENFFGQIRQQGLRDTNPTCAHFKSHFKTLLINNFSSRHSLSANCEDDGSKKALLAVQKFISQDTTLPASEDIEPFSMEIPHQSLQYISKVSLGYVSGFITKYVKKDISSCGVCIKNIFAETPFDEWHALICEKEYLRAMPAKLKYCNPTIITDFAQIYNIIMYMLPQVAYRSKTVKLLVDFVSLKVSLQINCPQHSDSLNAKLINKFVIFLCHNWTVGIIELLVVKICAHWMVILSLNKRK